MLYQTFSLKNTENQNKRQLYHLSTASELAIRIPTRLKMPLLDIFPHIFHTCVFYYLAQLCFFAHTSFELYYPVMF